MSNRYVNTYQTPVTTTDPAGAAARVPNERRVMIGLLIGFLVVSLLVLLAGRVPVVPPVNPLDGPAAAEYVARDQELLNSYGYTIEGKVHIPIDLAMDLIAERGLPTRQNPSPTP